MRKVKGTEIRNGIYHFSFSFDGERIRDSIGTKNPDVAEEEVAKKRTELAEAKRNGTCTETWLDACAIFIKFNATKRSLETSKIHIAWLTGFFTKYDKKIGGKIRLIDIESDVITAITEASMDVWVPTTKNPRSNATTNRYLSTLRNVLNTASRRFSKYNDVPTIEMLDVEDRPEHFLTREEAATLLDQIRGSRSKHIYDMVRFALASGLRRANVTHLEWSRVDLKRRQVWVQSGSSKSRKPIGIPLSDEAIEVLVERRGQHDKYVFTNSKGQAVHNPACSDGAFKRACATVGLDWLRWHDLRHAFASWHLEQGTPVHVLQRLGGWANIDIVVKTYGHLADSHIANFANNSARTVEVAEQGKPRLVAIK